MEHRNKPIIVTGASSGIGHAIANDLLDKGCFVFAISSNEEKLTSAFEGKENVKCVACDLGSYEDIERAIEIIKNSEEAKKGIFAIVNNAGVFPTPCSLVEISKEEMERTFRVNYLGMWYIIRCCWPLYQLWIENNPSSKPCILNVTSVYGLIAAPFFGAYTCSKHAIEAMTDVLRRELTPLGVRVVVVEPGLTNTPMVDQLFGESIKNIPQGPFYERIQNTAEEVRSLKLLPTSLVSGQVVKQLFATKPNTRVLVTWPTIRFGIRLVKWLLPDRWMDKLFK